MLEYISWPFLCVCVQAYQFDHEIVNLFLIVIYVLKCVITIYDQLFFDKIFVIL